MDDFSTMCILKIVNTIIIEINIQKILHKIIWIIHRTSSLKRKLNIYERTRCFDIASVINFHEVFNSKRFELLAERNVKNKEV